jgi:TonB family protein
LSDVVSLMKNPTLVAEVQKKKAPEVKENVLTKKPSARTESLVEETQPSAPTPVAAAYQGVTAEGIAEIEAAVKGSAADSTGKDKSPSNGKKKDTSPRRTYASDRVQQEVLKVAQANNKQVVYSVNDASLEKSGRNMGISSGLTKREVSDVIRSHLSEVRYCYEAASRVRTLEDGRVVLQFTVGGTGSVEHAKIEESSIKDPRLERCLMSRVKSWKFGKPKGGAKVDISYPFVFHSLGSGGAL